MSFGIIGEKLLYYRMEIVVKSNKVVLSADAPVPFTIERNGSRIKLQLGLSKMSLGEVSAKWLLESLNEALDYGYSRKEHTLVDDGGTVLHVTNESGYVYIIGKHSRFNMKIDIATKIISWMKENTPSV
jgi:hypothetical protein